MDSFLVSQALAAVAFTCGVVSFQCKKRRNVLLWLSASALTNAFHFFVLGRNSAGTLYVVMGVRVFTAAFTTDRRLMYLFMALILAGFFYSYERPLDILALFGSLLPTYGNFQRSDRKVRLIYMVCAVTWMVHNYIAGSPVAVLMETTFLVSNIIGYWRIYRFAIKA